MSESHIGKSSLKNFYNYLESNPNVYLIEGPDGNLFHGLQELAYHLGIKNTSSALKRIKSIPGYTILREGRSSFNKKVKSPSGIIYNSINECAKSYNRNKKTIRLWIETKPEKGFSYVD